MGILQERLGGELMGLHVGIRGQKGALSTVICHSLGAQCVCAF